MFRSRFPAIAFTCPQYLPDFSQLHGTLNWKITAFRTERLCLRMHTLRSCVASCSTLEIPKRKWFRRGAETPSQTRNPGRNRWLSLVRGVDGCCTTRAPFVSGHGFSRALASVRLNRPLGPACSLQRLKPSHHQFLFGTTKSRALIQNIVIRRKAKSQRPNGGVYKYTRVARSSCSRYASAQMSVPAHR
jgi:hypothetical protein